MPAEHVYADLAFPRSCDPSYVAINMVSTLDGKVSVGGRASPIGSRLDRLIMRNIRCAVDAVVVGAGTVRAEEMNLVVPEELSERRKASGLPGQPLGVILAGSGELPLERRVFRSEGRSQEEQRVIVIAGEDAPEKTLREASGLGARVLRAEGSGLPEPSAVLRLLKDLLNVRTVLLEGGPSINGSFLSCAAVDELFLTLSPKISLSPENTLSLAVTEKVKPMTTDFDLASIHSSTNTGELFLRYAKRHLRTSTPS